MNLYVKNHTFWFELENVTQLFFPNEKISVFKEFDRVEEPYIYSELSDRLTVEVRIGSFNVRKSTELSSDKDENELAACQMLYKILCDFAGIQQPWGMLTGVRPVKLLRKLSQKYGEQAAKDKLHNDYFVSEEKLRLAEQTEINEKKILDLSRPESFSLYVGIPFCPTRCSYCSFVSQSVEKSMKLIPPFMDALMQEIDAAAAAVNKLGLSVISIYMGGGTPTTLTFQQLDRLCAKIAECFDLSALREYTVEAGRPDTITADKLRTLRAHGVDRISVNPQTMSDEVLNVIGRRHTAADIIQALEKVRKVGGMAVNMDLIAGLPADSAGGFEKTLDTVIALDPENITVHTLSLKKGSRITLEGSAIPSDAEVGKMLDLAQDKLRRGGWAPYYLYRQKFMSGGFENVGWAKPGSENIYNVCIMEELCSIIALGGGGSTKLISPAGGRNIRFFAPKYPAEYISGIQKTCSDKQGIIDFYSKESKK